MTINPAFKFAETVYYANTEDQVGLVTGLLIRPGGSIRYYVAWADSRHEEEHFDFELSSSPSFGVRKEDE